jgi:aarF domain-containing kinase
MLLLDNFVHSDLHPGNIMIKFYKPTTSFVLRNIVASIFNTAPPPDPSHSHSQDAERDAIVSRLRPLISDPPTWRAELQKLFIDGYQPELVFIDTGLVTTLDANSRRNFLDLFRAVAEFDGYRAGRLMVERCRTPELAIDPETFALKIQHLVLNVKSKTFSLSKVKISDVLTDVLKAVRQHHVKMEADFINTVISVLLLEGIGRQLNPGLDLFKSSLPILRQLGRQMTAQESMKDLPGSNLGVMLKVCNLCNAVYHLLASFFLPLFQDLDMARGERAHFCFDCKCG